MSFLRLNDVTVEFPIYQGSSRSLKKAILAVSSIGNIASDALDRIQVRAIDHLSINIEEGDRVGLIGPNGSGKTTLLKVLAGIYEPSAGEFRAMGRISALLDVNLGLNHEATGYENIILRGMYMGIRPKDMRPYVDEIAAFTELGQYLDMPVRTYSAGMLVRLAFASSTCIPPEILLMDEWLAAGDAHFLAKAQKRMKEFVNKSSIMVLTSHAMPLLKQWCTKGLYIRNGKMLAFGPIDEIAALYERDLET